MRNYKIDILRGVSILLVLLHHFNIPYKLHDTWLGVSVFGEPLSTLIARNGNYGVTMFFVISGFLITQHTLQRNASLAQIQLKNFYIRRVARIIPCLVLLVAIVTILRCLGLQPFLNQTPNGIEVTYGLTVFAAFTFWMNILIIEYGWVNYALGVLWSLSVEEVFYLAFPLLCLTLTRGKAFVLFLVLIVAYAPYFRSLHFGEESGAYLYHYFSSFDGIAIGCLTALFAQKFSIQAVQMKWIIPVLVFLMSMLYLYAPIKEVSTWSVTVFALLTAILIFCFAQRPQAPATSIVSKIMVWIGQRSYEMYLFHLIILGLIKVLYFPKTTLPDQKLMLLLIFFVGTFVFSWLIEKYYSTPLNHKIRQKWITKKPQIN
ncbi:MAG TPA: acyltransferase [Acinetobacter ursingii]|uniref:Acyltransferase n=1 Tax=Acinetobacter ursingii TaxID=108980 RepID=A0A3D2SL84_9GAMM|nr:acyltransferase [Acinetobacter ursingii]MCH2006419.1 acyltransferase [Acinetobacter ursingii]MCU4306827.1 acyltransferase [Acinetobacter ursingii]MCU4372964.1 acyltransferase [Acinetobacter ursingii]MCU4381938.1 acyltransferase [Acinetobacter ursingii]MCU4610645.1 acyltransferase [Acinetobacter ursingii]